MKKSDKSLHHICIAKIKRCTMKPYDFKWSTFYENDSKNLFTNYPFELHNDELIICSIIIDADNLSVLTTKKLVTLQNGILSSGSLINSTDQFYGNFKSETQRFSLGSVELENGKILEYFIETGRASMIMIQGVRTMIQIQQ
ncbi:MULTISPECIES: hypothetical protein [unclassified Chryseobacterium]|uniref:hypothetical protein n=1 Tax=unclassified Chryseobacterium TaxID=2593645 RepID=UPI0030176B62